MTNQQKQFKMKRSAIFVAFVSVIAVMPLQAQSVTLPRSTPEAQGVSSAKIREYIEVADQHVDSMHSFMLVRHGHVVAETWWAPESAKKPHVLWSLSKSFTSTAVGLAVAEGKLSVDDPVLKFFPDDAPAQPSANLRSMRVRDLLTMNAGHQDELNWREAEHWANAFLAHPVPHKPGTHFRYNTPATYMLSAIVQKVTGETVLDYLTPRLFEPLGIEKPKWETSPQGISIGGYGLYLRTEDIAKFGQLYLQKGKWQGKQLLPESWVEQATSKQVSNGSDPSKDWDQGYGFQFWRCRHGAYRGDGKDGQFCIVLPEQDAVVAITAKTRDMQASLNIVWDKLLPAFADDALGENPDEQAMLKTAMTGLTSGTGFTGSYYVDGEIHVNQYGTTEGKPLTTGYWDFKPSWSKTGDMLVFFRRLKNDPDVSKWKTAIHIINADGTGLHQLTDGTHTDFNQTWTRDGSNTPIWNRKNPRTGGYQVMAGKVGGRPGEEIELTDKSYHTWAYTCLIDGRILVRSHPPKHRKGYFLMTPNPNGNPKFERIECELATGGVLDRVSLSPSETRVCFEYQTGFKRQVPGRTLYVADFDANRPAITGAKPFANKDGKPIWYAYPRWTKDESNIVYHAGGKLYLYNLADKSMRKVSTNDGADYRYPHTERAPK